MGYYHNAKIIHCCKLALFKEKVSAYLAASCPLGLISDTLCCCLCGVGAFWSIFYATSCQIIRLNVWVTVLTACKEVYASVLMSEILVVSLNFKFRKLLSGIPTSNLNPSVTPTVCLSSCPSSSLPSCLCII